MNMRDFPSVIIFSIFLVSGLVSVNAKTEKDLLKDFVQIYNKNVRPVLESRNVVPVQVQLAPIVLTEVDRDSRTFTLDTWLIASWKDEYLHWDPEFYGNLEDVRLPVSDVWVPDLSVITGTPDTSYFPRMKTNVVINHVGDVIWVPPFTIKNRCPALGGISDEAECTISLLSWTYDITQLDIHLRNDSAVMQYFEDTHPDWFLEFTSSERIEKTYSCCQNPYTLINFNFTLRKRK